ncbi:hypothetical protein BOVMAS03_03550 [Streptococcus uberis]
MENLFFIEKLRQQNAIMSKKGGGNSGKKQTLYENNCFLFNIYLRYSLIFTRL